MGFVLTPNGLNPGTKKTKTISDFLKPLNTHEVRRFCGLAGLFKKFVTSYAKEVQPISDLLKKEYEILWGIYQMRNENLLKFIL